MLHSSQESRLISLKIIRGLKLLDEASRRLAEPFRFKTMYLLRAQKENKDRFRRRS
jgi:hypothetical protein